MSPTIVIIINERKFRRTVYSVICSQHGRIAKRYVEKEAEEIAILHHIPHIIDTLSPAQPGRQV